MIAIIGGTGLKSNFGEFKEKEIATKYGKAFVFLGKDVVFIQRHYTKEKKEIPPHRINHRANIFALKKLKVDFIISTSSVGSLKKKIKPKSILIPDDYINFWNIPTFFDEERVHITPCLDESLREKIIEIAKKLKIPVIKKGVYFQTSGPRLETKAEISLIKNFADVVGMTMGSEATLANELNLKYASICQVDNYAHGIVARELDFRKVMKDAEKTRERLIKLLKGVIEELKYN